MPSFDTLYRSSDFNLQCDVDSTSKGEDGYFLGNIRITVSALLSASLDTRTNTISIRSKSSDLDFCSIYTENLSSRKIQDMKQIKNVRVKLLEDAVQCSAKPSRPSNVFSVMIPSSETWHESRQCIALHPEIETILLDAVTKRKRQDAAEIKAFIQKKSLMFEAFESEVNQQAELLSTIAIVDDTSRSKSSSSKTENRRVRDDKTKVKPSRRLSSSSSHSNSSSTTAGTPSRNTLKKSPKVKSPVRSSTTPLPKSALAKPTRKTSACEMQGGSSTTTTTTTTTTPPKKVMFSETEPTRFELASQSETEDDERDVSTELDHDLFDMDEQIPVMPMGLSAPEAQDLPATISTGSNAASGPRFGRQEIDGLSGSFHVRSQDKYDTPESTSPREELKTSSNTTAHAQSESSPRAASRPRPILITSPVSTATPLSSVKDITPVSISPLAAKDGDLKSPDDSPPRGKSRRSMWEEAVVSSRRMSGLVPPVMTQAEIEASVKNFIPAFARTG